MGAKCSKVPDSTNDRSNNNTQSRSSTPSRFDNKGSRTPERGGAATKRRGFAEAAHLGEAAHSRGPVEDMGWGARWAGTRSQELSPAGDPRAAAAAAKSEEKRKLVRALSTKATSVRSITSIVAKKSASKVTEYLRGAGTVGFGALDTFSSSVANLNNRGGFAAAAVSKGNKIGILAFEVANTIVKGCNLKMTLADDDIKTLKEEVLVSEGVRRLVSEDMDELLLIAASDKRNELKIFTDEVVRFGNHCKDPQWHNFDRVFQPVVKDCTEVVLERVSAEDADKIMDELMTLAQNTADLYHELHALDRFRTDLKRKQQEEEHAGANARGGETLALLKSEVKSQEKHVDGLKKRSLWSKTLEEVMEQLVDISNFLYQEIHDNFGPQVFLEAPEAEKKRNAGKLGSSGLALHYANLINQIDGLVQRPGSVPPNTRDNLYQGLPPSVKAALRARLQYAQNRGEDGLPLTTAELKAELDKILNWLVPVATNTTKAHHGFGWVGEWANTGSPADRRAMGYVEISLIQTLHHANQQRVENYILELIVGLHHLVSMAKPNHLNGTTTTTNAAASMATTLPHKSPARIHVKPKLEAPFVPSDRSVSPPPFGLFSNPSEQSLPSSKADDELLSQEDRESLHNMEMRKLIPGLSKSQEFDNSNSRLVGANKEFRKCSSQSQAASGHQQQQQLLEPPLYLLRNRVKPLGVSTTGPREPPNSLYQSE